MNPSILYRLARLIVTPEKGFGAATEHEPIVFGARRPGFPLPSVPQAFVEEWIAFMIAQNIKRVVCLLPENQLLSYHDL